MRNVNYKPKMKIKCYLLFMEMILGALKFEYGNQLQGIWPHANNICYIATFYSPTDSYNGSFTA